MRLTPKPEYRADTRPTDLHCAQAMYDTLMRYYNVVEEGGKIPVKFTHEELFFLFHLVMGEGEDNPNALIDSISTKLSQALDEDEDNR